MKFLEFLNIFDAFPLIDSGTFHFYTTRLADLRRQVHGWVEKKYLLPLKRGLYVLSPEWRKVQPSVPFIANFLHAPSYISLEYALAFHGLIPEKAAVLTSVTTRKTQIYRNALGVFEYRSLKKGLFWGFRAHQDLGQDYFIAEPEKALLDFFHLNSRYKGEPAEFASLRLQNLEGIDGGKLVACAGKFNRRVRRAAAALADWAREEEARLKRQRFSGRRREAWRRRASTDRRSCSPFYTTISRRSSPENSMPCLPGRTRRGATGTI